MIVMLFYIYQLAYFKQIRQISLHVQRRIRVEVGHVFPVKINPYWKFNYSFEIF